MLQFRNGYKDRDLLVSARRVLDGVDGATETFEPGEDGQIEIDGEHQVFFSTRAREEGEAPMTTVPSASKGLTAAPVDQDDDDDLEGFEDAVSGGEGNDVIDEGAQTAQTDQTGNDVIQTPTLREGSDDEVRAEISDMVTSKTNLTKGGYPELPVLNERLAAKGIGPVDAQRRESLMPATA